MSAPDYPLVDSQALAQLPELAQACRDHVVRAVGVPLEDDLETLPLLDHYLELSRAALSDRPELLPLVQRTVGAYFGHVLLSRFEGTWVLPSSDAHTWHVVLRPVYLGLNPVGFAHAALTWSLPETVSAGGPSTNLLLEPEDRPEVERRLAALPAVQESDFHRLSTCGEALEVVFAVLSERAVQRGDEGTRYEGEDYREDVLRAAFGAAPN